LVNSAEKPEKKLAGSAQVPGFLPLSAAFGQHRDSRRTAGPADPKLAWALRNRDFFPVDVNHASREALLRVPGLGVKAVKRILRIRRFHRLTAADLIKLQVPIRRAQPFIVTGDTRAPELDSAGLPERIIARSEQLSLFPASREAVTGEF
jgi:predicted DNA-binding helix-hairpin-helix protein